MPATSRPRSGAGRARWSRRSGSTRTARPRWTAWPLARRSSSGSVSGPSPLPPDPAARRRPVLSFALALALTAGLVAWQQARQHDPGIAYGRFQLPGFDANVYLVMAERPAVFTVAPWGYRVLVPS